MSLSNGKLGSNDGIDDDGSSIPQCYLQEIPLLPEPASGSVSDLKRTLDQLSDENARLHNELFAERHNILAIKCDLQRERERALEFERLLRQTAEEKATCVSQLERLDAHSREWAGQRALLTKACENLQAKTTEMEDAWRAKELRWADAGVAQEQRIRDLVERLTEANRQLRNRSIHNYHKRGLEEAHEQIHLLKQRLRCEKFGKVRESMATSNGSGAHQSMEILGLKRDNTRLTAKHMQLRSLEDQLVNKNHELNGFRTQLTEVQNLFRENLDRQNLAVHESKSFGVAIRELHGKLEAQLQEIEEYQTTVHQLQDILQSERKQSADLRAQVERSGTDRQQLTTQIADLQGSLDDLQKQLESARSQRKVLADVTSERNDLSLRLQRFQTSNADLAQKIEELRTENSRLRCELQNLIETISIHDRKITAQTNWYNTWKNDIDSVSNDLRSQADQLKRLRHRESSEIQRLKLRLAEAEDALKDAQAKNARMDSVLERVISTC